MTALFLLFLHRRSTTSNDWHKTANFSFAWLLPYSLSSRRWSMPAFCGNKSNPQDLHKHPMEENSVAPEDSMEYTDRFVEFMKKFGKNYKDNAEMLRRFKTYEKHMREVSVLNKNKKSNAQFGENDLSDWTDEEFRKSLLPLSFYKRLRKEATFIRNDPPKLERAMPAPDHFDWRDKNVISPVKAQGSCGSCWAFAATATVEAAWAIGHGGEMRNLSEQTLLDCDLEDNACDGGDEDKAFRYIHRHGLAYAADLPYVAHRQNTCNVNDNTTKIEVAYFLHPDEQSMIDWLVGFGPVNIGISVTPDMKPYKGGVFNPNPYDCKHKVVGLHSLMIVGYGTTEAGEKYWIVKNSWGNTWGVEHGYVYFARGVNACGIEDEPIGILA
ncbi:papain family cysteine protease [Cooperia oncophora]